MTKTKNGWFWILIFSIVVGCGPDTIFLRPGLDTPAQHVSNGYLLMNQKKLNDAGREFERAMELDPYFAEAYVGLGLVYGHQGDIENGLRALDQAKAVASNVEEHDIVDRGYDQLHKLMQDAGISPRQR